MPLTADITIRDYRPADFETLWRIDQECFAQGIAYSRAELGHYIRRRSAFTLVAEREAAVAGFVVADCGRSRAGHIITIDLLPGHRRAGLGSALMVAAEERLRAAGARFVYLETAVDNAPAIAFYKRLGYSVVRTVPRYYHGEIDALVMAKRL